MNVYFTDGHGSVHRYDHYRLKELGLPRDMRESTEQEITMFRLVEQFRELEKLVHKIADEVGIEWRE